MQSVVTPGARLEHGVDGPTQIGSRTIDEEHRPTAQDEDNALSRRGFAALSVAAGLSLSTSVRADDANVVETNVQVKTPDGTCDAALYHPRAKGTWPAVVVFPDALGLRPAFRDMGRRLASAGYVVLVPNPFYRSAKAPVFGPGFSFQNPDDMKKLGVLRAPLTPDAVGRDAVAYLGFLDSQKVTKMAAKAGVVGYCMGGPMTLQAAAASPAFAAILVTFWLSRKPR